MKVHPPFSARNWLVACAGTSLLVIGPTLLFAQSQKSPPDQKPAARETKPSLLKPDLREQLDNLYEQYENKEAGSHDAGRRSQPPIPPQKSGAARGDAGAKPSAFQMPRKSSASEANDAPKAVRPRSAGKAPPPKPPKALGKNGTTPGSVQQPPSAKPASKSKVFQHLQKLYRRSGRQMPPMNMNGLQNTKPENVRHGHRVPQVRPKQQQPQTLPKMLKQLFSFEWLKDERRKIAEAPSRHAFLSGKTANPSRQQRPQTSRQSADGQQPQESRQSMPEFLAKLFGQDKKAPSKPTPQNESLAQQSFGRWQPQLTPSVPAKRVEYPKPRAVRGRKGESQTAPHVVPASGQETESPKAKPFPVETADNAEVNTETPSKNNDSPAQKTTAEKGPHGIAPQQAPAGKQSAEANPPEKASQKSESEQSDPQARSKKAPQAGESEGHQEAWKRIAARKGRTGFKGFCPVVLREQHELADAKPTITATYQGQTYRFSTEEAKEKFKENPTRYAPVAGGKDVVLLKNQNEKTDGLLDHAVWYKDRLYFFASRSTRNAFAQEPSQYAVEKRDE